MFETLIINYLIPLALTYGMAYVCYVQYLELKDRWIERKKRREEYYKNKGQNS